MSRGAQGRAFSLIELLVVIGILAVISAIVFAALGGARAQARRSADTSLARTLQTGVEQFRTDFGFLPPLVKDNDRSVYGGYDSASNGTSDAAVFDEPEAYQWYQPQGGPGPLVEESNPSAGQPPRVRPNVFSFSTSSRENEGDRDYLRGGGSVELVATPGSGDDPAPDVGRADFRFSEFSLGYYLVGVLPARDSGRGSTLDGIDGPGFRTPRRSGAFDPRGESKPSYVDASSLGSAIQRGGDNGETSRVLAASGRAIRYYRWLPGDPDEDVSTPNIDEVSDIRIPGVVGATLGLPVDTTLARWGWASIPEPEHRDAGYAIVIAGADGLFGDFGTERAALLAQNAKADIAGSREEAYVQMRVAGEDNTVLLGKP
ncbi:MAG: type II secretion system protein [Planctomycetota bacterium]